MRRRWPTSAATGRRENDRRLAWIVETADVVEAPLYLQITRELHVKGLLEPSTAGQQEVTYTHGADRATLPAGAAADLGRAVIGGHLYEDVPLNRAERQARSSTPPRSACTGLRHDRLDVEFDDQVGDQIAAEVQRRLTKIDEQVGRTPGVGSVDVRLAAAWAAQLELVEAAREQRPVPAQPHAGLPRVAAAGRRAAGPRLPPGGAGLPAAGPGVPHRARPALPGGQAGQFPAA